jgi:hypothetical protein
MELADDGFVAAHEQFDFAVVVQIEGRTPDVGAIHDVLNRDRIISTFVDQLDQRFSQHFPGPLDPPIRLRHNASFIDK